MLTHTHTHTHTYSHTYTHTAAHSQEHNVKTDTKVASFPGLLRSLFIVQDEEPAVH